MGFFHLNKGRKNSMWQNKDYNLFQILTMVKFQCMGKFWGCNVSLSSEFSKVFVEHTVKNNGTLGLIYKILILTLLLLR